MNKEVEFYTTPEDMPIKRFQRFNKFMLIDVEVGETFEDYDQRTFKAISLLRKNMTDEAVKELENRRQMVFNAFQEYSPKSYALALLVKRIGDKDYTDKKYLTEEGLEEILNHLDKIGYSRKQTENDLQEVKKKSLTFWSCTILNTLKRTTKQTLISFLNKG